MSTFLQGGQSFEIAKVAKECSTSGLHTQAAALARVGRAGGFCGVWDLLRQDAAGRAVKAPAMRAPWLCRVSSASTACLWLRKQTYRLSVAAPACWPSTCTLPQDIRAGIIGGPPEPGLRS